MKLGTTELLMVLAVVVILFGPTQIPKLSRMFGKSVKGFRDGMGMDEDEVSENKSDAGETEA